MLNSEAIEYVKKPTEEFIRDSWRLVKRCTKPDRQGARMQSRGASTPAEAEAIQRSSQQAGKLTASSQRAANEQPATAGHRLRRRQQHTGQLSPRLPCMGAAATTSSVLPAQQQSADWSTQAPFSMRQPELTPPVARVSQSSRRLHRRLRLASRSWASSAFS